MHTSYVISIGISCSTHTTVAVVLAVAVAVCILRVVYELVAVLAVVVASRAILGLS